MCFIPLLISCHLYIGYIYFTSLFVGFNLIVRTFSLYVNSSSINSGVINPSFVVEILPELLSSSSVVLSATFIPSIPVTIYRVC